MGNSVEELLEGFEALFEPYSLESKRLDQVEETLEIRKPGYLSFEQQFKRDLYFLIAYISSSDGGISEEEINGWSILTFALKMDKTPSNEETFNVLKTFKNTVPDLFKRLIAIKSKLKTMPRGKEFDSVNSILNKSTSEFIELFENCSQLIMKSDGIVYSSEEKALANYINNIKDFDKKNGK